MKGVGFPHLSVWAAGPVEAGAADVVGVQYQQNNNKERSFDVSGLYPYMRQKRGDCSRPPSPHGDAGGVYLTTAEPLGG